MRLEEFSNTPFRMQDLNAAFPDCANLAMKAKRLEQSSKIVRLKKGLYMVSPAVSRREASPEKALRDLMVYTPNLNLRFRTELRDYLEADIRLDMEALAEMDVALLQKCAAVSRKQTMLAQLIQFITNERNKCRANG